MFNVIFSLILLSNLQQDVLLTEEPCNGRMVTIGQLFQGVETESRVSYEPFNTLRCWFSRDTRPHDIPNGDVLSLCVVGEYSFRNSVWSADPNARCSSLRETIEEDDPQVIVYLPTFSKDEVIEYLIAWMIERRNADECFPCIWDESGDGEFMYAWADRTSREFMNADCDWITKTKRMIGFRRVDPRDLQSRYYQSIVYDILKSGQDCACRECQEIVPVPMHF